MSNRRRRRRGRSLYNNKTKLNFTPVIVILCLSVGCGYAAAKYVVEPVVNYTPEFLAEKTQEQKKEPEASSSEESKETNVLEDEADVKPTGEIAGYAVQFGCYSGKASAESAKAGISAQNLQVIEQNNMYKIIGTVYKTKQEAVEELGKLSEDTKAFVTTVYE